MGIRSVSNIPPAGSVGSAQLGTNIVSGQSAVTAATNDYVLIADTSNSSVAAKALVSDITAMPPTGASLSGLGAASPATGDYIAISDVSAGGAPAKALVSDVLALATAGVPINNIVGVQYTSTATHTTFSSASSIPRDDTIPQISEGVSIIDASAYTPASASNIIEVEWQLQLGHSTICDMTVALFVDSGPDALYATMDLLAAGNEPISIAGRYRVVAGSTSARTYKLRAGSNGAGNLHLNGRAGARVLGGVITSWIKITEYKA